MSNAASRMRKRDNAARLGKLQMGLNHWLNTTAGQLMLGAAVVSALLLATLIGR